MCDEEASAAGQPAADTLAHRASKGIRARDAISGGRPSRRGRRREPAPVWSCTARAWLAHPSSADSRPPAWVR